MIFLLFFFPLWIRCTCCLQASFLFISLILFSRFVNPLVSGEYPISMKKNAGSRMPDFTNLESMRVKGSFDFLGVNYYNIMYVKDNSDSLKDEHRDVNADMAVQLIRMLFNLIRLNLMKARNGCWKLSLLVIGITLACLSSITVSWSILFNCNWKTFIRFLSHCSWQMFSTELNICFHWSIINLSVCSTESLSQLSSVIIEF